MLRLHSGVGLAGAILTALFITACGNGGTGDSPRGNLRYTGLHSAAHVSQGNANILAADIFFSYDAPIYAASLAVPRQEVTSGGFVPTLVKRLDDITASAAPRLLLGTQAGYAAVSSATTAVGSPIGDTGSSSGTTTTNNSSDICYMSGSYTVSSNVQDDGTGTVTFKFVDCDDSSEILNGVVSVTVRAYSVDYSTPVDMRISYSDLRMNARGMDATLHGTVDLKVALEEYSETYRVNLVLQDNLAQKAVQWRDVTIIDKMGVDYYYSDYVETITGRIYDSKEGYVDITTEQPLHFSYYYSTFPDGGGPLLLTGDKGSRARLMIVSSSRAQISVDEDADGVFEATNFYSITNLGGTSLVNQPPVITMLQLSPATPDRSSVLRAQVSASDPEGEELQITYIWARNDVIIDGAVTDTLAATEFAKGDSITFTCSVSDGTSTVSQTASVVIGDTPPVFSELPPAETVYGQPLSVQLQASDADGETVQYSLAYGPDGMRVDTAGKMTWTAISPMFQDTLEVHYGVRASAGAAETVADFSIVIKDATRAFALVHTSIGTPSRPNGLALADFDGDGINEILMSDQRKALAILGYDKQSGVYREKWVYPFDLAPGGNIGVVAVHDVNADKRPDILVAAGKGITVLDGVTHKILTIIDDQYASHYAIEISDLDRDGQEEIVVLAGAEDSYYSGSARETISIYKLSDYSLIWRSLELDLGPSVAVGNVDTDAALEIVTAKGYVYDGATHLNEWAYGPGFGYAVDTGDLDNDGVEEIVGAVDWTAVRAYSAVLKSPLWEITPPFADLGALLVTNIDADPAAEIIFGNGQWGNVSAYSFNTTQRLPVLDWSIDAQNWGVSSLLAGDVDGDGKLEIVWTSDSGGPGAMVVAGFNPAIGVECSNGDCFLGTNNQYAGPFTGARFMNTGAGKRQGVFGVNNGSSAALLAIDMTTGVLSAKPLNTSYYYYTSNVLFDSVDYDGDGVDEALIGTAYQTSPYFAAYDPARGVEEWTSAFNQGTAQAMAHGDLNGDGHADLVALTEDGYIYVYDMYASTLLWKSTQLPGSTGFDVKLVDLDSDGAPEIVALSRTALAVYKKNEQFGYILATSKTLGETYNYYNTSYALAVGDFDQNGIPEVLINLYSAYTIPAVAYNMTIFEGVTLDVKAAYAFPYAVTAVTVGSAAEGRANLILGITQNIDSYNYYSSGHNFIAAIDAYTGKEIWRSPDLLGPVQYNSLSLFLDDGDGRQRLIVGGSNAMYITR